MTSAKSTKDCRAAFKNGIDARAPQDGDSAYRDRGQIRGGHVVPRDGRTRGTRPSLMWPPVPSANDSFSVACAGGEDGALFETVLASEFDALGLDPIDVGRNNKGSRWTRADHRGAALMSGGRLSNGLAPGMRR